MPETVYRQRDPQNTAYYQCIEDHFEIAFIEEMDVIRKVLKHLALWDHRPRPKANPPLAAEHEYIIEDAVPSADDMAVDPIYPAETYF